jgi:hypothetical protein
VDIRRGRILFSVVGVGANIIGTTGKWRRLSVKGDYYYGVLRKFRHSSGLHVSLLAEALGTGNCCFKNLRN